MYFSGGSERIKILRSGARMPGIGFGTYQIKDTKIIETAIQAGYRHFDTASFYGNERVIGDAIRNSGIDRDKFFITTKLWPTDFGYINTLNAIDRSLYELQTDYIDLYLIHWPKDPNGDMQDESWRKLNQESWRAIEDSYSWGKIHAMGVSNFLPHHIFNLMETAKELPMIDQLEIHPGMPQKVMYDFCVEFGLFLEAWSPLGRGRVLNDPLIKELAKKYNKNEGQICIAFCTAQGIVPLPKASTLQRMKENLAADDFEFKDYDMERLLTMPPMGWSGEHPDRKKVEV